MTIDDLKALHETVMGSDVLGSVPAGYLANGVSGMEWVMAMFGACLVGITVVTCIEYWSKRNAHSLLIGGFIFSMGVLMVVPAILLNTPVQDDWLDSDAGLAYRSLSAYLEQPLTDSASVNRSEIASTLHIVKIEIEDAERLEEKLRLLGFLEGEDFDLSLITALGSIE